MTTLSRFEIHQPQSVAEASQMLGHYGDDGAIYAGGTELLLAMRHRALSYSHLIDLKVIPGLNAIEPRDGVIEIGAACTHRAIERSALVREKQPVLAHHPSTLHRRLLAVQAWRVAARSWATSCRTIQDAPRSAAL